MVEFIEKVKEEDKFDIAVEETEKAEAQIQDIEKNHDESDKADNSQEDSQEQQEDEDELDTGELCSMTILSQKHFNNEYRSRCSS